MYGRLAAPRPRIIIVAVSLLLAGQLVGALVAQDAGTATAATGDFPPEIVPDVVSEPSLYERIDAGFATAVDYIALVLFHPVMAKRDEFVQFQSVEYYTRPRGTTAPFTRHNPNGRYESNSLDDATIKSLAARGILVSGNNGPVMAGKIGDRLVDYVVVTLDDAGNYVLDKGVFKRVTAPRGLLSETDTLTMSDAEAAGQAGQLVLDPKKLADGDAQPYIQTQRTGGAPIVVLWLAAGSVFFTFYMGWFNVWGFRHAIEVVRGKYDNPNEPGEVTHFQALASALSATVGLGNIAGVTIAMTIGGPGAFFWMMACGVFGMTSKFVECTLGQKYRHVKPDGTVLGGPMRYLHVGLAELGLGRLGLVLSILFAIMCILASFGGGNMFQANQSGAAMLSMVQKADLQQLSELNADIVSAGLVNDFDRLAELEARRAELVDDMDGFRKTFLVLFGVVMATMVAFVIIGGIKRIGAAAARVVPTMCLIYVGACLWIIVSHLGDIPPLIASVFSEALSGEAIRGGVLGVLVIGVQRAAFSNEAGVGSAAIAHSAAKTEEPIREGAVALMGPFIDTIVVCAMTALVILITGAWNNPQWTVDLGLAGSALTTRAFEEEISWFPYVLAVAIVLFAYSTIISWSYYGERCWESLFGAKSILVYRVIYVACVLVGAIVNLGAVLEFSDIMILSMAFPNILGCALLAPKVKRDLADYWQRYHAGEFKTFK